MAGAAGCPPRSILRLTGIVVLRRSMVKSPDV